MIEDKKKLHHLLFHEQPGKQSEKHICHSTLTAQGTCFSDPKLLESYNGYWQGHIGEDPMPPKTGAQRPSAN